MTAAIAETASTGAGVIGSHVRDCKPKRIAIRRHLPGITVRNCRFRHIPAGVIGFLRLLKPFLIVLPGISVGKALPRFLCAVPREAPLWKGIGVIGHDIAERLKSLPVKRSK